MTESQPQTAEQQPERPWTRVLIQIVVFQLIMRFLFPKAQPQTKDSTGAVIPPLTNVINLNDSFDLAVYIHTNKSAILADFLDVQPNWYVPNLRYSLTGASTIKSPKIEYIIPEDLHDKLIRQKLTPFISESNQSVKDKLISLTNMDAIKHRQKQMSTWDFVYLVTFIIPRKLYPNTLGNYNNVQQYMETLRKIDLTDVSIARQATRLIDYVPIIKEEETKSLLDHDDEAYKFDEPDNQDVCHWKNHIDIKVVVQSSNITPSSMQNPYYKKYLKIEPEKGVYKPVTYHSDLWLLESNYIPLNETTKNMPLELTLTYKPISEMLWQLQAQFSEIGNIQDSVVMSSNPLMALHTHSRKESFMLKRVFLDTNPYLLIFSAVFMFLHTIFSILAFKNDVQFWKKNESMEGLSALSIVSNFICEVIIALYLYDSRETSTLILMEIFFGLALSAWKVTKAVSISINWRNGLPRFSVDDKKESLTKKYDRVAIKFMSMLVAPLLVLYSLYALKYKKFRSWYSFIISTLAGSVYAFGFITMTPQLYINYKLKSVDHLPWRAFTYKALNTFVDDIAAFIIDMPWMHRLACFRDDIIFVCYLYQRWIYKVDKTRPSEWVDPAEQAKEIETNERLLQHAMDAVASESEIPKTEPETEIRRKLLHQESKDRITLPAEDKKTI